MNQSLLPTSRNIVERLRVLPPNIVYAVAPKAFVLRGYEYFHQERLESLGWRKDGSGLIASVRGSRSYAVEFLIEDENLVWECDCPAWTSSSNCKHVICALLTIINLLAPQHFNVPRHNGRRLEKLRSVLIPDESIQSELLQARSDMRSPEVPDAFEIVITLLDQFPEVFVRNHGTRVKTLRGVPTSLAYFIGDAFYPHPMYRERLVQHLETHGNMYPLVVETDNGSMKVRWDRFVTLQIHTELRGERDWVTVQPLYLLNGEVVENVRLFWGYAVDMKKGILVKVEETTGWDIYDELYEDWTLGQAYPEGEEEIPGYRDSRYWDRLLYQNEHQRGRKRYWILERTSFAMSLPQWQSFQINVPSNQIKTAPCTLAVSTEGRRMSLVQVLQKTESVIPRYRIVISPRDDQQSTTGRESPKVALRLECWWGDCKGMPHGPTFSFLTCLEQFRGLPAPLRAQKRKKILYETFLTLLTKDKPGQDEDILRKSLSGGEFRHFDTKRVAKKILKGFLSNFRQSDMRLQFYGGQWHVVPIDKAQEVKLYRLLYEQFGSQIFQGMTRYDEMNLPLDQLHQQLPQLYEACQAVEIDVWYHTKPVTIPQWEFFLEAEHPEGIDWFELRPEIRCNGIVMVEKDLRRALQGNGILETDDAVHIFPAKAQAVARSFSLLYRGRATARGTKKEMIQIPRLQILDWIALRKEGVQIRLPAEEEAIMDRLLHFDRMEMPLLPKQLQVTLRPYQRNGYAWLAFLYSHRFGGCLADDMGLGKTLQAISVLGGIHEGIIPSKAKTNAPHLIVLPPSLVFNWEQELTKWYPSLRLYRYVGPDRVPIFEGCDVVLTTYGIIRRDIATLEKIGFHLIVFDEAQAVKNLYADTTSAVRRLRGVFKMVMTGTPLENHIGEYYSLIDLCLPGLLGEIDKMKTHVKTPSSPVLEVLTRRTKPFVLRRTKEQILTELPPKIETDVYLDLTEHQKALYHHTIAQIRPTIEEAYRTKTQAQARIIALTAILKLRQVCLSTKLVEGDSHDASPKITFLLDRLKELMEAGHSALVFSQFTSFLDIVESAFRAHHIPFFRLDGSTPIGKRKTLVQGFQEGSAASVFLLSLKAGGQGLNLTKASYVFHLDPWWNPAVENQASDRTHRIGQTQHVTILRILMRHSIEEKMMELKKRKLALYEAVLEGATQRGAGVSITKTDFDFLLSEV